MGRKHRDQLPGAAFHICSRTQGRRALFREGLRDQISTMIIEGIASSDSILMSYAVMRNHFHIVLRQGTRPLGWVMQPIIRRIALLVHREFQTHGHVFERNFRSFLCDRPRRLRRAIVYSNLNPVRAKLCSAANEYVWTSHNRLVVGDGDHVDPLTQHTLRLFADDLAETPQQLSRNYLNYVEWRLDKDRHVAAGEPFAIPEPVLPVGDAYFYEFFAGTTFTAATPGMDLRDRAIRILRSIEPAMSIDELRRRYLPLHKRETRRQVIAALLTARYRGYRIADFFRVSAATVSSVASAMRYSTLQRN